MNDQVCSLSYLLQIGPTMKQKSNLNHPLCFPGILEKVDYLDDLGVDSVWLSPFYSYGGVDMGYDWLDHTKVDYRRVYT